MSSLRFRTLVVLLIGLAPIFLLLLAGTAAAGSVYTCENGDIHAYYNCVKADKPVPQPCQPTAGNPVDVLTGRKHEEVLDWSSGGAFPFELRRTYSSSSLTLAASPYSSIGRGWRTNFDARAKWGGKSLAEADWVHIVLPDSFEYHFKKVNGVWTPMLPARQGTSPWIAAGLGFTPRSDIDATVTIDGPWIVFRTPDDKQYVFDSGPHQQDVAYDAQGLRVSLLSEVRFPEGYAQKVTYRGDYATRVTDTLGRWIAFEYEAQSSKSMLISRVYTSDGEKIGYTYANRFPTLSTSAKIDFWSLSAVTHAAAGVNLDGQQPRYRYEYLDVPNKPGLLLTGIIDERGVRTARWTYDSQGRALSSEHAGGVDHWNFAYDDAGSVVTVTNPLGRQTRYTYRKTSGLRQLLAVDGIAAPGCAASNTRYGYDANGFRNVAIDAEGRRTAWTRDARGLPLSIVEGNGSGSARTTLMTWDSARPRPLSISRPGLTTRFTYGASGEVSTITQTDTTSQESPYATSGQSRTTTFSYTPVMRRVPSTLPDGAVPLPDVDLPLVNPAADQGVSGWNNLLGTLKVKDCGGGNACFTDGTIAYQDVAIPSAVAGQVDAGRRYVRLNWRQSGSGWCFGLGAFMFFDAAGTAIGTAYSSLETPYQWTGRELAVPVPRGTRTVRVYTLRIRWSGTTNEGYFDDFSLTLFDNDLGSAAPFIAVQNPFGFGNSSAGWTALPGQGGLKPQPYWDWCPFCSFFFGDFAQPSRTSVVSQDVEVPATRIAEIDAGWRGLDLSWNVTGAWVGNVLVKVEFLNEFKQALDTLSIESPPSTHIYFAGQLLHFEVVPPGTRSIRLTFNSRYPYVGGKWIGFSGVALQLTPLPEFPSDPVQLLTAVDGPLPGPSDTVRYGYDASGNLDWVSDELGHVTRVSARYGDGQPAEIVDPNGVTTSFTYDDRKRLASVTTDGATTRFAYDVADRPTRVTLPDNSYLAFERSDAGRVAAIRNPAGERIEFGYDANGDVTSRRVKSASGAVTRQQTAAYDALGRLSRLLGAAGQVTSFGYDRTDNLVAVRDPRGGLLSRFYDGLQQLVASTDPSGAGLGFARDGEGRLIAFTDARGLTTSYVRNGFGEVIQESGPDVGTTTIIRDARGLPIRITDPRGVVTDLSYDAKGRLASESYPADPTQDVSYVHDSQADGNMGVDRLTGIVDASGSTARYYDPQGRVTTEARVIEGQTYVIRYAYDRAGRLAGITYPSGRAVGYARNSSGRITGVTTRAADGAAVQSVANPIVWSPLSDLPTSLAHGNGLVTSMVYDRDGRLKSLKIANGSAMLTSRLYAYGDGMNLTMLLGGSEAESGYVVYDAAQRLASWFNLAGDILLYGYNQNGDRVKEVLSGMGRKPLTTLLNYPAATNRLASTTVNDLPVRRYAYDAAGNIVTQFLSTTQRLDFAYNQRNRPVTVTRSGAVSEVSRYAFNALEQMVSRRTTAAGGPRGPVHYIYGLDGSLLAEADGATGAILREYIWLPAEEAMPGAANDNVDAASATPLPLALVTGVDTATPRLLMVHADHLRRPIRLTDMSRATVWSASYDPFGLPLAVTGTVEQNLRFPGQYFLLETGLAYNWHRLYDPATGRYTQPDPLRFVDGPSVYGYAGGSPLMRVDPEGGQSVPIPLPGRTPVFPWFPGFDKPGHWWMPGWHGPIPHARRSGGSGGGNGGGGDNGDRCDAIEDECIDHCILALDNCALADRQSMNFPRCVNQCKFDQDCGGNDYSDGWDNGKLGTPRPWLY